MTLPTGGVAANMGWVNVVLGQAQTGTKRSLAFVTRKREEEHGRVSVAAEGTLEEASRGSHCAHHRGTRRRSGGVERAALSHARGSLE
jgi:hypothetical protein